jgi:hypothetical protein
LVGKANKRKLWKKASETLIKFSLLLLFLSKAALEESNINFEEIFLVFQGRLQEPTLKVARRFGFQVTSQFEWVVWGERGKKEQMEWVPKSLNYCTREMGGTSLAGFPCPKKTFSKEANITYHCKFLPHSTK